MENKIKVYRIRNVEEYGKLISFCIQNDICVFRSYWDDRKKGDRCYQIDWNEKRLLYSSSSYYNFENYAIVEPNFELDKFGNFQLRLRLNE